MLTNMVFREYIWLFTLQWSSNRGHGHQNFGFA